MNYICQLYESILNENNVSRSESAARKIINKYLNKDHTDNETLVVFNKIRSLFNVARSGDGARLIQGITRLYYEENLGNEQGLNQKGEWFNKFLVYLIESGEAKKFGNNLNLENSGHGLSLSELEDMYNNKIKIYHNNKLQSANGEDNNTGYTVIKIKGYDNNNNNNNAKDYEFASFYDDFVDWCITQNPDAYDDYTDNGLNQFYFCLRIGNNGVTNEKLTELYNLQPEPNEELLGNYGLSMLAISVNMMGELVTCTCRWNHDNGGNDHVLNEQDIYNITGIPFNTFKGKENSIYMKAYKTCKEYNINTKYLRFRDNIARVSKHNKYNFINADGEFLLKDKWVDSASEFNDGYAIIIDNGKYNLINQNGKLFFKERWVDSIEPFNEGWARIQDNGKYNYINKEKKLLIQGEWADMLYGFHDGWAEIKKNNKWNFINRHGEYLLSNWVDGVKAFIRGWGKVMNNGKWNLVDTNGNFFLKLQWADWLDYFYNGTAPIQMYGVKYSVKLNGDTQIGYFRDISGNINDAKTLEKMKQLGK